MTESAARLHLSRSEARLITTGLGRIWSAHRLWEVTRKLPYAHAKVIFNEPGLDRGIYSTARMQEILASREKLQALSGSGGKLEVNAFELAACLLAVRVTKTELRHRHVKSWRAGHQSACRRLETKLENHRKRAKRRFVAAHGQAAFSEASRQWNRFVRCVRAHFLYCACNRTRHVGLGRIRRLRRKERIEALLPDLKQVLFRWGRAVPPEAELRKLLGQALRSARRYTRRRDRRGLATDPDSVRRHIFDYVAPRCPEGPDPYSVLMNAMQCAD